ncbi:MAG: hypothetical protein NTV34_20415, partial [Proteobacteria bacterium]|nr:hypothetical protein [Pseudomonadota bacterium]
PEIKKIKICSLIDVKSSLPFTVNLSKLEASTVVQPIFSAAGSVRSYPIQITLTSFDDYKKILPYINSATSFRLSSAKLSESGVFTVSEGKVAAQVGPDGVKAVTIDKVMTVLNHDFAFRGPKTAVFSTLGMDIEKFKAWLNESNRAGRTVFIRVKSNLVPVSSEFMTERIEVADFVQKIASTVLIQKVDIIAFKAK